MVEQIECMGAFGFECVAKTIPKTLYGTCKEDCKCEDCIRLMAKDSGIKGFTFQKAIKDLMSFEVTEILDVIKMHEACEKCQDEYGGYDIEDCVECDHYYETCAVSGCFKKHTKITPARIGTQVYMCNEHYQYYIK